MPTTTLTKTSPAPKPPASEAPKKSSPYIAGPVYDWVFFLSAPLLALVLGIAVSGSALLDENLTVWGNNTSLLAVFIGTFIHAHLVAVFYRSHGNPQVFKSHKLRFLLVPVLLFVLMMTSPVIFITVSVVATFWDVYHSGLQTFGFARIYDSKIGNDACVGRRLDWWLNHVIYAGPIIGGATMLGHFGDLTEFENVGLAFFSRIPAFMYEKHVYFTWSVIAVGTAYVAYYVYAWSRLYKQGHAVSKLKVFLLASTAITSIYTWGFNSFGMAFFIMNFFHALQYLGIVWWAEKKNLVQLFGLERFSWAKPATALIFVLSLFAYGLIAEIAPARITWFWGITLVVSIMHFWYDGFVWSVRRKQV